MYEYDYYNILNVKFDADYEEIKASYRKLAKIYHPDLGGSDYEFKKINEAYKVLSDSAQRNIYNEWYKNKYIVKPKENTVSKEPIYIYDTADSSKKKCFFKNMDYNKYPKEKYTDPEGYYFAIRTYDYNSYLKKSVARIVICTPYEFYNKISEDLKQKKKKETIKKIIKFACIASLIILYAVLSSLSLHDKDNSSTYTSTNPDSNLIECEFPENGHVYNDMKKSYMDSYGNLKTTVVDSSPLEINLPDSGDEYYYIKLVDDNGNLIQSVFMYPNTTIEIDVPYGEYTMKYCCGKKWYGYKNLFGSEGSYAKCDTILSFDEEWGQTVTLYPVVDGNMRTENIDFSEF